MAKQRTMRKEKSELNVKGIAIIVAVLAVIYIIYTNFLAILIGGALTTVIIVIIVVVGAYYILGAIGATGIAALFTGLASIIGSIFSSRK